MQISHIQIVKYTVVHILINVYLDRYTDMQKYRLTFKYRHIER